MHVSGSYFYLLKHLGHVTTRDLLRGSEIEQNSTNVVDWIASFGHTTIQRPSISVRLGGIKAASDWSCVAILVRDIHGQKMYLTIPIINFFLGQESEGAIVKTFLNFFVD